MSDAQKQRIQLRIGQQLETGLRQALEELGAAIRVEAKRSIEDQAARQKDALEKASEAQSAQQSANLEQLRRHFRELLVGQDTEFKRVEQALNAAMDGFRSQYRERTDKLGRSLRELVAARDGEHRLALENAVTGLNTSVKAISTQQSTLQVSLHNLIDERSLESERNLTMVQNHIGQEKVDRSRKNEALHVRMEVLEQRLSNAAEVQRSLLERPLGIQRQEMDAELRRVSETIRLVTMGV